MSSGKLLDGNKSGSRKGHDDELRNTVAGIHHKRGVRVKIDQGDANLATIRSVNRPR